MGASKEALIQLELMSDRLKRAYDASEALRKNVRAVCELGRHYSTMEKEVQDLRLSLEAEKAKSARLEKEKSSLEDLDGKNHKLVERLKNYISLEIVKTALEKKDTELAAAQKEASRKAKEPRRS